MRDCELDSCFSRASLEAASLAFSCPKPSRACTCACHCATVSGSSPKQLPHGHADSSTCMNGCRSSDRCGLSQGPQCMDVCQKDTQANAVMAHRRSGVVEATRPAEEEMRAPALQVHQPGTAARSPRSSFVPCSMSRHWGRMLGNGCMRSGESRSLSNQDYRARQTSQVPRSMQAWHSTAPMELLSRKKWCRGLQPTDLLTGKL